MCNHSSSREVVLTVTPPNRMTGKNPCPCSSPHTSRARGSSRSPNYEQNLDFSNSFNGSYVQSSSFNETPRRQRGAHKPSHSTPVSGVHPRHSSCGSPVPYDLSWMPGSFEMSDAMDSSLLSSSQRPRTSSYLQREANRGMQTTTLGSKNYSADLQAPTGSPTTQHRNESLIEWFDRSVENELSKRLEGTLNIGENLVNFETPPQRQNNPSNVYKTRSNLMSPGTLMLDHSSSHLDISSRMRPEIDTDLLDAVDKFAKVKAMMAFEGAVKAAEEAAASAPPEYAEEAAAAGVDGYQAQVTGVVQQEFKGVKPIEVIGYVGITRPKNPHRQTY